MSRLLYSVIFGLLLFSFIAESSAQDTIDLIKLEWLIGTWKRETKREILYERWIKVSNRTFEGDSYSVNNGDTTFVEFLRLEQFGAEIFYTPKVAHNKYPVPFKLIKAIENEVVFENLDHDFPQRIIYKRNADGSLDVRIEGDRDGEQSGADFSFVKEK